MVIRRVRENPFQFFNDVQIVDANISCIQEDVRKIADINQSMLQATTTRKKKDFYAELEPCIRRIKKNAVDAKRSLLVLRSETETLKAISSNSNEVTMRGPTLSALTRKYMAVLKVAIEKIAIVFKCKADIKKNGKRHVQIVKPDDLTTEEIAVVLKSGVFTSAIITVSQSMLNASMLRSHLISAMQGGDALDLIRNAYENFESVSDKCKDVLLETSVAELHQIFLDLAQLAEREGDLTVQIELCWKEADVNIDHSEEELAEAIVLQKSIRARQCCFFVIFFVVIGALVGGLTAKFA